MTDYATLTRGTEIATVTGTGILRIVDTRDGWTAEVEHEGTSEEAVAQLIAEGFKVIA